MRAAVGVGCVLLAAFGVRAGVEPEVLLEVGPSETVARASEGDLAVLKDGRWLLGYSEFPAKQKGRYAAHHDHAKARIVTRTSSDNGRTWSEPTVAAEPEDGDLNVMSVSFLRLRDGRLALFYIRKCAESDGRPVMRVSADEGRTWSAPQYCVDEAHRDYYVLNNARAVRLSTGRIVLPLCLHSVDAGDPQGFESEGRLCVAASDDDGQNWRMICEPFKVFDRLKARVTVQEPGIVELADGRLLLYARTNRRAQWGLWSSDGGATWSAAEPLPLVSPNLAPATITRLKDGNLVAVWNDYSKKPSDPDRIAFAEQREPFSVAWSKDDGRAWSPSRTIEADPPGARPNLYCCYFAVREIGDSLYVFHCHHNGLKVSHLTKIPLTWVYASTGHSGDRASFGPLSPSAVPYERQYIWPAGRMPDVQAHQVAAKSDCVNAPGFRADDWRFPYLEWFAPEVSNKTDLCVVTVSGGGFNTCCDALRLQPAIDRLVRAGITVANLTYRTPRPVGLPIYQSAWEDLQRAVRVVKSEAVKRGFSPDKVGATGISAGAKTVLLVAMRSKTRAYTPVDEIDELPCDLLFAIPQAPAYVLTDGATDANARQGDGPDVGFVPELTMDAKTCPMCFFQGGADAYSPLGSTRLYRELRRRGIPAELHLFADRWHGFHGDMNRGEDGTAWDHWFDRALEFIRQMNYDGGLTEEIPLLSRFPDDRDRGGYEKMPIWSDGRMPDVQTNQCRPYLEWHFPKVRTTKAIQIVYSGGSYMGNSPDGFEVAPIRRYLNAKGMTVVTMKYRTPRPLGGLAKHTTAWQDLQRAIRIVRSQAVGRGLDPERIGIMGSSAGGHLALMGAVSSRHQTYRATDEIDRLSCSVRWAVAIYPAYALTDGLDRPNKGGGNGADVRLAPEFSFDLDTCPVLFIHGDADGWAAMNSVVCWEQLRRMGIQCDLHTLATRKHCFQAKASPGTGSYTWMGRIWEFMNQKDCQGTRGRQ